MAEITEDVKLFHKLLKKDLVTLLCLYLHHNREWFEFSDLSLPAEDYSAWSLMHATAMTKIIQKSDSNILDLALAAFKRDREFFPKKPAFAWVMDGCNLYLLEQNLLLSAPIKTMWH